MYSCWYVTSFSYDLAASLVYRFFAYTRSAYNLDAQTVAVVTSWQHDTGEWKCPASERNKNKENQQQHVLWFSTCFRSHMLSCFCEGPSRGHAFPRSFHPGTLTPLHVSFILDLNNVVRNPLNYPFIFLYSVSF